MLKEFTICKVQLHFQDDSILGTYPDEGKDNNFRVGNVQVLSDLSGNPIQAPLIFWPDAQKLP